MAYRFNGVECDTFEELQRLQRSTHKTSAVVQETRQGRCERESCQTINKSHFGPCPSENRTVREAHGKDCECLRCESGVGHP